MLKNLEWALVTLNHGTFQLFHCFLQSPMPWGSQSPWYPRLDHSTHRRGWIRCQSCVVFLFWGDEKYFHSYTLCTKVHRRTDLPRSDPLIKWSHLFCVAGFQMSCWQPVLGSEVSSTPPLPIKLLAYKETFLGLLPHLEAFNEITQVLNIQLTRSKCT